MTLTQRQEDLIGVLQDGKAVYRSNLGSTWWVSRSEERFSHQTASALIKAGLAKLAQHGIFNQFLELTPTGRKWPRNP